MKRHVGCLKDGVRNLRRNRKAAAFTLVELLVVIAIIAILAALLLPALTRGKARAQRIQCIGNLKELGVAFQMFAHDHRGRFPAETILADGGSLELVQAGENISGPFYFSYRQFQPLAAELAIPKILLCPTDIDRQTAASFSQLQNSNLSYFVGVTADYNVPLSIVAGDRNITNAGATASLVNGSAGLRWTDEMHFYKGNVLFADAHVEQVNEVFLNKLPGVPGATFFLPAVVSHSGGGGGSSPPSGSVPIGSAPPPMGVGGPSAPPSGPGQPPSSGGAGSSAPPPQASQSASSGGATPGHSPSNSPSAPTPAMRDNMMGSRPAPHSGAPDTFIATNAKETNAAAVTNGWHATVAAPAADDEDEPPLLWLMGAVRSLLAGTSWWLLLLLFLLVCAALYFYAKKKMREHQRKRR